MIKKTILSLLSLLMAYTLFIPTIAKTAVISDYEFNEFDYLDDYSDVHFDEVFEYLDLEEMEFDYLDAIPKERVILKTSLVAIAGSKLNSLRVGSAIIRPVVGSTVHNHVSRNFRALSTSIGGRAVRMRSTDMVHVLGRHHQNFWRGSGSAPSLFARSATPNSIRDIGLQVLRQNEAAIRRAGINGTWDGRVGGHRFRVVVRTGNIITIFPLR